MNNRFSPLVDEESNSEPSELTADFITRFCPLRAGFNLWLHYITFFYCVTTGSAVSGAVNKALQSAATFVLSWAVYCPPALIGHLASEKQCLNIPKVVCAVIVLGGVILYGVGPSLPCLSEKRGGMREGLIQG